jgi:NAD-dependent DNA ligase
MVFDDDPMVIIEENKFVFTGIFLFGTRAACESAVIRRGGMIASSVTTDTNYLVVGSRSSPDWIVANFGRKIQKAAEMAISGDFEISIIREADWVASLRSDF